MSNQQNEATRNEWGVKFIVILVLGVVVGVLGTFLTLYILDTLVDMNIIPGDL